MRTKIFEYDSKKTNEEDTRDYLITFGLTQFEQKLFKDDLENYIEKILEEFTTNNPDVYFGVFCGKYSLDYLKLELSEKHRATFILSLENSIEIDTVEKFIEYLKFYYGFDINRIWSE